MKEKRVATIVVVIVFIVAILVTGAAIYLVTKGEEERDTQLITKDPSEMVLTLDDLPSGYTVISEGPVSEFENSYHRDFLWIDNYTSLGSEVRRFLTIGEAESFYNSKYNESLQREIENAVKILSLPENIGDQSFAVDEWAMEVPCYDIYFRKANVVGYVGTYHMGIKDAIQYAYLMENKINKRIIL